MSTDSPLALLIEDDPDTSVLFQSVLFDDNIEVIACDNGQKARSWIDSAPRVPDVLILDVRLPDTNGLDLCREFFGSGKLPRLTPVLVLSAHGDPRLPSRCREAGAAEFLDKLVDLDVFLGTVRRLLNRQSRDIRDFQ